MYNIDKLYNNYKEKLDELNERYKIILADYKSIYPLAKSDPNAINTENFNTVKQNLLDSQSDITDFVNELDANFIKIKNDNIESDVTMSLLSEQNKVLSNKVIHYINTSDAAVESLKDKNYEYNKHFIENLLFFFIIIISSIIVIRKKK